MIAYTTFSTPLGAMYATLEGRALTGIYFEGARHAPAIAHTWRLDREAAPFIALQQQLQEYFEGRRRRFVLPFDPRGTPFQVRVWEQIARVEYGSRITYAQLAEGAGAPGAVRAAGAATGRNPFSIVVPCHRVVGSDGSLTGYAGGVERKRRLLEIEGALQPLPA